MNERVEEIEKLIAGCSPDEISALKQRLSVIAPHRLEREWRIDAETVLTAISRSSDLTKRGVRGIIAEAVFESHVIPSVRQSGWVPTIPLGGPFYDAALTNGSIVARIQIKLQRREQEVPKLYYPKYYEPGSLHVVEVQKTRGGEVSASQKMQENGIVIGDSDSETRLTRPYRFSDFDILAVNMEPSSRNWRDFRYTVASWLLSRVVKKETVIEIFQPVASVPNHVWTDDLAICLEWFSSGRRDTVLTELLHRSKAKKARGT